MPTASSVQTGRNAALGFAFEARSLKKDMEQSSLDGGGRNSAGVDQAFHEVLRAKDSAMPLLFLCDHASNLIPSSHGNLGLGPEHLERHIAYDPGAAGVTRLLSAHFGAAALLGGFSRLLVDPNRGEDDPTLIMRIADRTVVPGNRDVDAAERTWRLETFYRPYHDSITSMIDQMLKRRLLPLLISIHSFTETWRDMGRPWHVSVLWDQDVRVVKPLLSALRNYEDWVIGENEPYSGALAGDTLWRHGVTRGLPHALIEVRQDLIRTVDGQQQVAGRLVRALEQMLAEVQSASGDCSSAGYAATGQITR